MCIISTGNNEIPCPKPVKNNFGKYAAMEKLDRDSVEENNSNIIGISIKQQCVQRFLKYLVRLLTYIRGAILFSVEYTKELFYQVGELVAKTDLALMVSTTMSV